MKICYLVILLSFFSCNEKKRGKVYNKIFEGTSLKTENAKEFPLIQSSIITYVIPKDASQLNSDSLINQIKLIPLETNPDCQIGKIDRIFCVGDTLIVVDKSNAKSVFMFTSAGKFLAKINSYGEDVNKYSILSNVSVDKDNHVIAILDDIKARVFYYDFRGGLLKSIQLGLRFHDFIKLNKDSWLVFNPNLKNDHLPDIDQYCLMILKENEEIVYKGFCVPPKLKDFRMFGKNEITENDSSIFYFPRFSDTVFRIHPAGKIEAVYKFNVTSLLPLEFLYDDLNRKMFASRIQKYQYNYFLGNFFANSTHILTTLYIGAEPNKVNYIIINRQTNQIRNISNLINKGNMVNIGFNMPIGVIQDQFVAALSPDQINYWLKLKNEYHVPVSKELATILKNTVKDSNPILALYSLK